MNAAVTLGTLQRLKQKGEKIACVTSYDASFTVLLEAAGVDIVLVGDSLGNVIQGHDSTLPVTMEPRSGLALWEGISIVNTPGTIDSGYRNEWMAIVVNLSNNEVILHKGDRICQIILSKMYEYEAIEINELPNSERGLDGFGSTGKK